MVNASEKNIQSSAKPHGEDTIDRINYYYSSLMLFLIFVVVTVITCFGKPIQCWIPRGFPRFWKPDIETVCYNKGTYFVPSSVKNFGADNGIKIDYYEGIPLILLFHSIFCILPYVWYSKNSNIIDFNSILTSGDFKREAPSDSSFEAAEHLTMMLQLIRHEPLRYSFLYIGFKLLCLARMIIQVFMLHKFLNTSDIWFGYKLWNDIRNGRTWETTGVFPRVTFCDYMYLNDTTSIRTTFECSLTHNGLFERLFIGIWFWIALSFVATVLNVIYWTVIIFVPYFQKAFVKSYLAESERPNAELFIQTLLKTDGVLALRLLSLSAGIRVTAPIIEHLYSDFKKKLPVKMSVHGGNVA